MKEFIRDYKEYRRLLKDIKKSPFVIPKTKIYFGRKEVGGPYFFPRKVENGKFKDKLIAIEYTHFGWKTKFDMFRYEWNPGWSFIFFDYQIYFNTTISDTISPFGGIEDDCYWEGYLNWTYNTDTSLDDEERFKEFLTKYSCTWGNDDKGYTDYMYQILKPEYITLYDKYKEIFKDEID